MKRFSIIILTTFIMTSSFAQDNGWMKLFDGSDLTGWHCYGQTAPCSAWKVEDGVIHLNSKDTTGSDLVTNDAYENFDLKLEWKISKNGNSGIIFLVQDDPKKYDGTWYTGLEMQVLDNEGHDDGKIPNHRAGNLYDMIEGPKAAKPVGEWNQVEIVVNHGKLNLYLNGVNVVTTTMWDDNWKNMIAHSKFKNMPGFGTFKSGHIALQDHGDDVWYRNISIKKL